MRARQAFTLVEVLIVVVILAIVAAVALPKFSNVGSTARASMLADDLRLMRAQLVVFKAQHRGVAAGYPDCDPAQQPTEAALQEHMTLASNASGETAPLGTPGYRYGPYMREIPPNPFNDKTTVEIVPDGQALPAAGDDSHGWIYQPSTLTLLSDTPGADEHGRSFYEY